MRMIGLLVLGVGLVGGASAGAAATPAATSAKGCYTLADGRCVEAVSLLQQFQEAARREFRGRDRETDDLLKIWGATLASLASKPEELVGKVDWITKHWLLNQFKEQEKIDWSDAWLKSQDLEFHHVDPARSLGLALAQTPTPWKISNNEIEEATLKPPRDTRAHVRSRAMHLLRKQSVEYYIDWEITGADGGDSLHLLDPFDSSPQQAETWSKYLGEIGHKPPHNYRKNKNW